MKESFAAQPFTGNLLVASSLVTDPFYASGVCLIVHQDNEQVIGVMLNRPLKPEAGALMAMLTNPTENGAKPINRLADQPALSPGLIHFGGPLSGPVVALHQESQFAESEPGSGIYLAAQKQHLEDLIRQHPTTCRLIVGHLSWSTDQFASEIEAGLWHMVPATADAVFASPIEMWPRLIRRATSRSMARWMGTPDAIGAAELN